ncbi:ornithinee aminotransferase, partial [Kocuria flava]
AAAGLGAAALAGRSEEPGAAAGEQAGGAPGPDQRAGDERVRDEHAGDERVRDEHAGDERAGGPAPADAHGVPDHVDHEEWHEDDEPAAPTGHRAAAAAGTGGEGSGASAPGTASRTDVPPSYRAHEAADARPSQDRLAQGNLVLAEADVLRRLADAQRRLFGEDGTAMDVSTVLVRVRALGTYYDALTHVRKNGFWDQRRTFDLVPEELLHVQELKDESYVEGAGSPLAMMFRFRPGIPPEVSFDYGDEEAFVRYEQRLPAQNYLEELRMYPRTGANIPQHMNEALQDWTY